MAPLLELDRLTVTVPGASEQAAPVPVVREVSFTVATGEMVGLVGESGAGKSLTAYAILRLLPAGARIAGGRVLLEGRDLAALPEAEMRRVRGRRIGMVFQEPMTALNPTFTVGFQVAEAVRAHRRLGRAAARAEALRLLDRVALAGAARRLDAYPHELSGGQRQRVVIAMALACDPALLLADEPTTALDVTVQAQILDLLRRLREELGLAVLLVTHDLAVVAETCERALVMYRGRLVEEGPVGELFAHPAHAHTRALLSAAAPVAAAAGGAAG
ncbi:MAG TPA: ABC transporter ATP-binding protein [Thermoanaerobaculia bacterium]|nr:ABC transporter ATP-binding protein [Thermoanaerobaculia bacterium]